MIYRKKHLLLILIAVMFILFTPGKVLATIESGQGSQTSLQTESNQEVIANQENSSLSTVWNGILQYFQDNILKAKILLVILTYLLISIFILFFAIIINRYHQTRRRSRFSELKNEYQSQLASFLFDDEIEHFEFHGIHNANNRQIFIDELRDLHSNLHGETADKLRDLYFNLGLHKDSLKKVNKRNWYTKAKGFRELAQMDVKDANDKIVRYVNSKNPILRVDAQVAMVKLAEDNPLSFLDELNYELSYWEQINIYDTLVYHQINIDSFEPWLNNVNSSVVTFAVRMIGLFKHVQSAAQVRELLRDESPEVRLAAVQTLGSLEMNIYSEDMKSLFYRESELLRIIIQQAEEDGEMNGSEVLTLDDIYPRKIRYAVVEAMRAIVSKEDIPFFTEVINDYVNSHKLRLLAIDILASLNPDGEEALNEILMQADEELKNMIINVKENQES